MPKQLKITRSWFLSLLILANMAYLTHNVVGWFITIGFFVFVPGFLLLKCLKITLASRWETMSFSLGLSLLSLMLGGLVLNTTAVFGLHAPLTTRNIFMALDLMIIALTLISGRQTFSLSRPKSTITKLQWCSCIILTSLPLFAIGGAIRLNNGASDVLTLILFALIAILFLLLMWHKELQLLYPYAIIMMGLSILFTISLRGWFITGHDIQREFYVFQLTDKASYWNISIFRDPYNACLSITILPTVLAKITSIPAPYIFKVVFQIIFSIGLVPIYLLIKKMANERFALLGAFIFISFPTFLNDMPFLNRQEIAFIFFGLLMFVSFMEIARKQKIILTTCCLIGLILSHYSSSYVTIAMIVLAALFHKILAGNESRHGLNNKRFDIPLLSLPIIIVGLLVTFLWNFQLTTTTNGLTHTLKQTVDSMFDHSSVQSGDVSYSLLSAQTPSPPELLAQYAGSNASQVHYITQPDLPVTKFGSHLSTLISPKTLNSIIRSFSAKILQILLLIGIVIIFLRQRKNNTQRETYFLALSLSCLVLLTLQTLLPQLSVDYGTLRFFQQALIILAIPIILGSEFLLAFLGRAKIYVIAGFFAILFLHLSGFIPQIIGGYPAQLSLNNSGEIYNDYYVHRSEIVSAEWLVKNRDTNSIEMDTYAQLRFLAQINNNEFPMPEPLLSIGRSSYIYEDFANTSTNTYDTSIDGDHVSYTLATIPSVSKNLIYSNGQTQILR